MQNIKKKLPINTKPSIASYVQHAYPLAIIESHELINLYVSNIEKFHWHISRGDIRCVLSPNRVDLFEDSARKDTDFNMWRICTTDDEIVFKMEYFKWEDNLAYIEVSLNYDVEMNIDEVSRCIYRYRWNQYDIHINEKQFSYYTQNYIYHKIKRENDIILAYTSMDGSDWVLLDKFINQ